MTPAVIILIVLGIVFIFASFAITEKKQEEDFVTPQIPKELSEDQKKQIDDLIGKYMDEKINGNLLSIEAKFAEIVNEKTLALGDYAVTVNEEIEKNHNEVTFLYSMLNDKQKEIMTTATMIDDYRKDIEAFVANNIGNVSSDMNEAYSKQQTQANVQESAEIVDVETKEDEASSEQQGIVEDSKDIILEMHNQGLSILEIAKHLGLGVGEVKLVVDLYQGVSK
ncbi:MAG: DUF6115 domain-containing protein [Lachnospiraceae bacterium]|nr:DUF6115 domain-containing protein [Lachnospiraceae bacterium]